FDDGRRSVGMKHIQAQNQHLPLVPFFGCYSGDFSGRADATNSLSSTVRDCPVWHEFCRRRVARVEPTTCSNGTGHGVLPRSASTNACISALWPLSCPQRARVVCVCPLRTSSSRRKSSRIATEPPPKTSTRSFEADLSPLAR